MHARSAPHAQPRNALRARRACALLALALALVLAQALGLMHRVTHFAPAGTPLAAQAAAEAPEDCGWVAALFAGHQSETDCRLFDPLSHDGPPPVAVQLPPVVLASFFLVISQGDFVARWAALFDARGPPAPR